MNGLFTRIVSVLMVLVFPSAMTVAQDNAMVYTNGNVTVNGSTVSGSSVIVAGDNVQSDKNAMAMISHDKSTVRLSSDSNLAYQGNSIELKSGASVIATKNGMVGRLAGLSASPTSAGETKFGLVSQNGKQTITALENPLEITDGVHTVMLAPGQSLTHNVTDSQQEQGAADQTGNANGQTENTDQTSSQKGNKKKRGGAADPQSTRGIPGWGIELMIEGSVGGALIGLDASGAFAKKKKKSPSAP